MKKKLCMLFAIVLLLVGGCNEKSQNYFTGTILKITDNYFIVSPDDSEPIRETSDNILVPKEVVSSNESQSWQLVSVFRWFIMKWN